MEDIRDDVRAIRSHVSEIKTTVAVMERDLAHHVKRSDLNENRISRIENWLLGLLSAIVVGLIVAGVKLLIR